MIELKEVSKSYGKQQVLNKVSLSIPAGEKLVICGPSGSGKSTLIRCINGLCDYDHGSVTVHQYQADDPSGLAEIRKICGMVFQQFNLFPHLTVLDNLTLAPVLVKKHNSAQAEEKAMALLERVQIADHAHKYPRQLSGGQQQRVAIARTLAMEPKIILFDEPTSALDPEMIKEVLDVMRELATEGMTMLCVTHEMGFAKQVADRIAFMDEGKLLEITTPTQFFSNPQTERARLFLDRILHH